jgi:hypothetical protein
MTYNKYTFHNANKDMLMPEATKKPVVFPKKTLNEIIEVAALSPSSHNTQPWKVRLESGEMVVGYRPERQLKVGDPDKRELFISLGCFIESIHLAAEDRGYKASYTFLGTNHDGVARIGLTKSEKPDTKSGSWDSLIRNRRSDRRLYEEKKLSPQDIADLDTLGNDRVRLVLADQQSDIEFLATMTRVATLKLMTPEAFRSELATWVRNNWTKKPDGMPGYTQGMPGPISLLAKFVIKKNKGVASDQAKKDGKRVTHSAAVGLICVTKESHDAWIEAGRLYQRTCLEALRRDIKTSAVSAAVIAPSTSKQIVKKLKLGGTPVALLRFGYKSNTPKAAPRLKVKDFAD